MKRIYASKRLQNTKLYKEHQQLIDDCYKSSLRIEQNQQSFFKRHSFIKAKTGEFIKPSYSFENEYKKSSKSIEQRSFATENLAKERGKKTLMLTLTLNEQFHPFLSIDNKGKRLYVSLNKAFAFKTLFDSIIVGCKELQIIWRDLYQRLERGCNKIYYVKVIEFHASGIPHMHVVVFVDKEDIPVVFNRFEKIKKIYKLNQIDIQSILDDKENNSDIKTNIKRPTKYLMKYITKSIHEDPFYVRVLDGLKRKTKTRLFTSSRLDLNMSDYKTIYYNLDKDIKDSLVEKAIAKDVCLYYFLLKNTYKAVITKKNQNSLLKQYGDIKKAQLRLFINRTQLSQGGYKINNLSFFVNDYIYKKETNIIIRRN
ncbi:MAG: replication endonuclease [Halarcobacter sp.]